MDSNIVVALISGAGAIITAGVAYALGAKNERAKAGKTVAETEGVHIENVDKAVKIWEGLADQLRKEISTLKKEVDSLREENKRVHEQVLVLQEENVALHKEIEKLQDIISKK